MARVGTYLRSKPNSLVVTLAGIQRAADYQAPVYNPDAWIFSATLGGVESELITGTWDDSVLLYLCESQEAAEAVLRALREREAKQEQLRHLIARGRAAYIRFGPLPKDGRSYNHRDGLYEPGVSVYEGWVIGDDIAIDLRHVDALSAEFIINGSSIYEVRGTQVGTGSDHEPLLRPCRIARKLTPATIYRVTE